MADVSIVDSHMDFITLLSMAHLDLGKLSSSTMNKQSSGLLALPDATVTVNGTNVSEMTRCGYNYVQNGELSPNGKGYLYLERLRRKRPGDRRLSASDGEGPDACLLNCQMDTSKKICLEVVQGGLLPNQSLNTSMPALEDSQTCNSSPHIQHDIVHVVPTGNCHQNRHDAVCAKLQLCTGIVDEIDGCSYMHAPGLSVTECPRCLSGEPGHLEHILQSREVSVMDTS